MRWKGIIFIIVIIALSAAMYFIFSDHWIETRVEKALSSANGAKVEIDNFRFSIFKLSSGWDKIQVANPEHPMKNLFETGKTSMNMEFMPLIRQKIVIDTLQLTEVKTNTDRTTSGELPKKNQKEIKQSEQSDGSGLMNKAGQRLKATGEEYKNIRLESMKSDLNIDSIMLAIDLSSIEYIDSVKKTMEEKVAHWEGVINADDFQKDYKALESEFEEIKKIDPKAIKTVDDLKAAVKKLEKTKKKFDKVYDQVKQYEDDFNKDLKSARLAADDIGEKVKTDYAEIEKMAKIPNIDTKNLATFIFGETATGSVNKFFEITEKIAYYKKKLSSVKSEKEKPKRGKGQYIEFSQKYKYPDFWIKNMILSGELQDQTRLAGKIINLTSDPKLINQMTEISFSGKRPDNSEISGLANIDDRSENSVDTYQFSIDGFSIQNFSLSQTELFPYTIANGRGKINSGARMEKETYLVQLDFFGSNMIFEKKNDAKPQSEIQKFLDQSITNFQNLEVRCKYYDGKFAIKSNIDDLFSKEIKNYLDKNITEAKAKIHKEIDNRINKATHEYEQYNASAMKNIKDKLNHYKTEIDQHRKEIDDKKSETEKEIKKKGGKALDNLFNS
ncbi:MAG: TIGR03545 family protein [Candidatus Marinimicrobia bacterium]|nr:TIGR03545 family protein [Candidatus Neomarinimicrobiota bacterium]